MEEKVNRSVDLFRLGERGFTTIDLNYNADASTRIPSNFYHPSSDDYLADVPDALAVQRI